MDALTIKQLTGLDRLLKGDEMKVTGHWVPVAPRYFGQRVSDLNTSKLFRRKIRTTIPCRELPHYKSQAHAGV